MKIKMFFTPALGNFSLPFKITKENQILLHMFNVGICE